MEQLELNKQQQITNIITARYSRHAQTALDGYFKAFGLDKETIEEIIRGLEELIENPLEYPGYVIPESAEINRRKLLPILQKQIEDLRSSRDEDLKASTEALFVKNNRLIKYCTYRWLLANAGVAIEIMQVKEKLPADFKTWLAQNFDVHVSDQIIHRHVISNEERNKLKEWGIETPYENWDEEYYKAAMRDIQQMLLSNPESKGILSDGSWTYNPRLFDIASDGKPYASFTFLKDDKYTGHRFFLITATPDNDQAVQLEFAKGSERRKRFIESGELKVDVYGIFYPRDEVLAQDFN